MILINLFASAMAQNVYYKNEQSEITNTTTNIAVKLPMTLTYEVIFPF